MGEGETKQFLESFYFSWLSLIAGVSNHEIAGLILVKKRKKRRANDGIRTRDIWNHNQQL